MEPISHSLRAAVSAEVRYRFALKAMTVGRALVGLAKARKPLVRILRRPIICLGCGRGDHQDCSGITFRRSGKNRRQPCGCRCRKAKSA
jgi:hypothetical protein